MKQKRYTINNGKNIKFVYDISNIPDGWKLGGLPTTTGRIWVNNGIDQKTIPKESEVPTGWFRGRLPVTDDWRKNLSKSHTGQIIITNGTEERHINQTDEIPNGWYRGKTDDTKTRMSKANVGKFNITNGKVMKRVDSLDNIPIGWRRGNVDVSEETRKKLSISCSSEQKQRKTNETKKKNKSFNTSQPEEKYYQLLIEEYGVDDVVRQYRDKRYPFDCDFYIKSKDLFIECNFHWTHGCHPFDSTSATDMEKLKLWENRSKYSKFYKQAIYVWTQLDVKKKELATQNHLNYKAIYN